MVFRSLRVGFPTARVVVWNNNLSNKYHYLPELTQLLDDNMEMRRIEQELTHAEWLSMLVSTEHGRIVILDTDIMFWERCEDWQFELLLAGAFSPAFKCPAVQAWTAPRLHTSFMWIRSLEELRSKLREVRQHPQFYPYNPFAPMMLFDCGEPVFYDVAANLYQQLGGTRYGSLKLDCYDHLHSGTIVDLIEPLSPEYIGVSEFHKQCYKDPTLMRGLWRKQLEYYKRYQPNE